MEFPRRNKVKWSLNQSGLCFEGFWRWPDMSKPLNMIQQIGFNGSPFLKCSRCWIPLDHVLASKRVLRRETEPCRESNKDSCWRLSSDEVLVLEQMPDGFSCAVQPQVLSPTCAPLMSNWGTVVFKAKEVQWGQTRSNVV